MKKSLLLIILLLSMIMTSLLLTVQPTRAEHEAIIEISPKYFGGDYPETKIFNVFNSGPDSIVLVIIAFPDLFGEDDTDFKPIDYDKPEGWTASYEVALRQVIFQSLDWETYYIGAEQYYDFKIVFEDGPHEEGMYEWIITTSDSAEVAHTYYRTQWIDVTPPKITITHPLDGSKVNVTYDEWPDVYFFWTNGTVSDGSSGVKHVKVKVYNETWDSDWVFATIENGQWYYKWYTVECGWDYTVEAKAEDNAGNIASTSHEFKLQCRGTTIELTPNNGTVGPTSEIDPETGWHKGSIYSYGSKTLGTTVKVHGFGFNENSNVSVYVDFDWLVKEVETNPDGEFTTSFVFLTLPGGDHVVYAEDDAEDQRYAKETFTINPEIIYKPETVIGPAIIEAIATGLPSHTDVAGFTIDGTDALLTVNHHITYYWYTDDLGVLRSSAAGNPGFSMPVLQPGTYEIALWSSYGEGDYKLIVANKLLVVNCFEDLCIKIDRIDGNVVDILTEVGLIEIKLDDLKPVVARIDGNVVDIETIVGNIQGTVTSIDGNTTVIKTDVGDIYLDTQEILGQLPDVPDSTLTSYITTILSAIAAIAAIIAAAVVTKRLKVAA